MRLRDTTVVFLCGFIGIAVLLIPMPVFNGPYEGIPEGEVEWTCAAPLANLAPPDVDIEEVRDAVDDAHEAARSSGQAYETPSSPHPLCGGLARTQVVMGLLFLAAGFWRGRRWCRATADARAERKFKRLHTAADRERNRTGIFR